MKLYLVTETLYTENTSGVETIVSNCFKSLQEAQEFAWTRYKLTRLSNPEIKNFFEVKADEMQMELHGKKGYEYTIAIIQRVIE